jgi:quercetin dioxygenase-like cupin family protein
MSAPGSRQPAPASPMPKSSDVPAQEWGTDANPLVHPVTGERIVFRRRSRDTGGEFLEMSLVLGPSGFVAAEHVHPNQEERFEISGAPAMFRVAGQERLYQPGEVAIVPAGTPHVWWNPGDEEVTTLIRFSPALDTETFFETFFGLARDEKVGRNGLPNPLQMMVLARAYRREMQLPRARQRVLYPIAVALAPIGRALGFRDRYDKYSGPRPTP